MSGRSGRSRLGSLDRLPLDFSRPARPSVTRRLGMFPVLTFLLCGGSLLTRSFFGDGYLGTFPVLTLLVCCGGGLSGEPFTFYLCGGGLGGYPFALGLFGVFFLSGGCPFALGLFGGCLSTFLVLTFLLCGGRLFPFGFLDG